ncbi:hypothetical protein [Sneathiella litorea]|uniref:Novel toxin 16 domain-containing protein n=1 Tax=Sneathiella litorea TaxID=2606216 RepID=A0A6L8WC42_9PROT|nr:hypothetical protein [Sneathiella litorea]MZR31980.1 hypothetical protein [Sneathiella litorea]
MRQLDMLLKTLFPMMFLVVLSLAAPANGASKEDDLRNALITNGQACAKKGDQICANACQSASKNIADKAGVDNCFWLHKKAAMGGRLKRGDPTFEKMRHQSNICTGHRDAPCAKACNAAAGDPANAQLVAQCNGEYQRVVAAHLPPKPKSKPEASMTLAQRIALMNDKGAYCKAKDSYSHDAGTQRAIMRCKRACLDKRINNANNSDQLREKMVSQCETAYYNVYRKLGK